MCFFEQLLSNFRYKKQLLIVFWATFEQIFEKFRGNFLENLEQLVESTNCAGRYDVIQNGVENTDDLEEKIQLKCLGSPE